MKPFKKRSNDHLSAPKEPTLIRNEFEFSTNELASGQLFCGTVQTVLTQVRERVASSIVIDESTDDPTFQRRFENASVTVNETDIVYSQLAWSTFNDPFQQVSITTGDKTLGLVQGEDIPSGRVYTAVSMSQRALDGKSDEPLWNIVFDGPYSSSANMVTVRRPGELGEVEATGDDQLNAATLAIDDFVSQI